MRITPELLERYAKEECSDDEIALVENWVNSFEDEKQILENTPFSDTLDRRLRKNIGKRSLGAFPKKQKTNNNISQWLIAASITLLIGVGSFIYMNNSHISYKTGAGELKTIVLADGSKVTLNAMSELVVPQKFNKNTRALGLQGEAFFKVSKDSLHPFVVNTEKSRTEVLGTEFNLTAYKDEAVVISLIEGKVHFSGQDRHKNKGVVLSPGQQAVLKEDVLSKKKEESSAFSNAWMERKLVFKSEPFHKVCKEIERFYGITIDIQKEGLHDRLYRGNHDDPSLSDIIRKMSFVLKFKYKNEGRTLIIH